MKFISFKIGILVVLFSSSGFCQSPIEGTAKTIMLILGSGNLETSISRAEVGFDLYSSKTDFDYIIVSGGCGGCFNDKDLVDSNYVIEGKIIPKQNDKTDYGAIYENCMNNPNYCKSVLWPKIDAAYTIIESGENNDQNINLFIKDLVIKNQDSTDLYFPILQ